MMSRDDMMPFEAHLLLRKDRAQGVALCQPHIGTGLSYCSYIGHLHRQGYDSLAEWSKALASGASPQGRGFEPHSCHFNF